MLSLPASSSFSWREWKILTLFLLRSHVGWKICLHAYLGTPTLCFLRVSEFSSRPSYQQDTGNVPVEQSNASGADRGMKEIPINRTLLCVCETHRERERERERERGDYTWINSEAVFSGQTKLPVSLFDLLCSYNTFSVWGRDINIDEVHPEGQVLPCASPTLRSSHFFWCKGSHCFPETLM